MRQKLSLLLIVAIVITAAMLIASPPSSAPTLLSYPKLNAEFEVGDRQISLYKQLNGHRVKVWQSEDYIMHIDKALLFDYDGHGDMSLVVMYWRVGDYFADREYLEPIRGDLPGQHINIYSFDPYLQLKWGGSTMHSPLADLSVCADDYQQLCGKESTYDNYPTATREVRLPWHGWSFGVESLTAAVNPEPNTYFVAVSAYQDLQTDYTLKQLRAKPVVTLKHNSNLLPDIFTQVVEETDDIPAALAAGKLAILLPEQVQPDYQTLTLNGQYFWSPQLKAEAYPLKSHIPGRESNFPDAKRVIWSNGEIAPVRDVARVGLDQFQDYDYVYDFFRDQISQADLAITMLENPLQADAPACEGCLVFVANAKNAKAIAAAGYDIVAAAGNHMGDAGQDGFISTKQALSEAGLTISGFGNSYAQSYTPVVKDLQGLKIGLLAADDVNPDYWFKQEGVYGVAHLSQVVDGKYRINSGFIDSIPEIKRKLGIDFLIVYVSWGVEYTAEATVYQQQLAYQLSEHGVDLVLGTHPHWSQRVEIYDHTPLVFSFGNFVFDQTLELETREAVAAKFYLVGNQLKAMQVEPVGSCGPQQTSNNLTSAYLTGKLSLGQLLQTPESAGCVYYQPHPLPAGELRDNLLRRVLPV